MQGIQRQSEYYATQENLVAGQHTADVDLPDPSEISSLLGGPSITGGMLRAEG